MLKQQPVVKRSRKNFFVWRFRSFQFPTQCRKQSPVSVVVSFEYGKNMKIVGASKKSDNVDVFERVTVGCKYFCCSTQK